MRIPLDYYRILGVPIQATAEQLQQAHRDRTLQLPPRREFSETAVAARRSLIDEAYAVLSDPNQRQEYDASFLAKSYDLMEVPRLPLRGAVDQVGAIDEPDRNGSYRGDPDLGADSYTPCIEIDESQFVGVLLILFELGEYELVLKLGRPYLVSGNRGLRQWSEPDLESTDILLAVALACLELGREQWNQGQFENAAESLDQGREMLLRAGVFAQLRGEMQAELFKLRPYRILELLALPESHIAERRQGLTLLQEMLQDRGGIDGSGMDQSGLSTDDFLRFIQQLRGYLTSAEQQALFEVEARRPSPVATYLAVYALVARGFAERQPALVRRAKTMLMRLGSRQDVHLEQAVCALLLGQTEEASRALDYSQEYESLAFIRDHSQGSPDLLPGLCLYSERWLQNEVFPHFRDLASRQASLKDYFADEDVQAYLEELPNEPEVSQPWTSPIADKIYRESPGTPAWTSPPRSSSTAIVPDRPLAMPPAERSSGRTESPNGTRSPAGVRAGRSSDTDSYSPPNGYAPEGTAVRSRGGTDLTPVPVVSRRSRKGLRLDRILFIAAIALLGLTAVAFAMSRLFNSSPNPTPDPAAASPETQSASPSPAAPPSPTAAEPLNETTAATVIQSWLTAKTAAMGNQHQTSALDSILADPLLSEWRSRSQKAKAENWYWQYEHPNVEIVSVTSDSATGTSLSPSDIASPSPGTSPEASPEASPTDSGSPTASPTASPTLSPTGTADGDRAEVEAIVTERGDFFANGQIDQSASYEDSIRARYSLVRSDNQWRIEAIDVLE